MDEAYHFFLFVCPLEALKAIDSEEFAVVVSDQSMSGAEGRGCQYFNLIPYFHFYNRILYDDD
jgi:hypothetical protein